MLFVYRVEVPKEKKRIQDQQVQCQSVEDQSACHGEAGQSDKAKKKRVSVCGVWERLR